MDILLFSRGLQTRNINIIILNGRKLNALWKKRSGSLEQRPGGGKCTPCAPEVMGGRPAWNIWFTVRRETRGIRPRGLWLPPQELVGTREPRRHLKADTPCSEGVLEEETAAPSAWSRITGRLEGAGHGGGQGGSRNGQERCCGGGRGERETAAEDPAPWSSSEGPQGRRTRKKRPGSPWGQCGQHASLQCSECVLGRAYRGSRGERGKGEGAQQLGQEAPHLQLASLPTAWRTGSLIFLGSKSALPPRARRLIFLQLRFFTSKM